MGSAIACQADTKKRASAGAALLREARYLRQIGPHPNIVRPFGAFIEDGQTHLVMEYAKYTMRAASELAGSLAPARILGAPFGHRHRKQLPRLLAAD